MQAVGLGGFGGAIAPPQKVTQGGCGGGGEPPPPPGLVNKCLPHTNPQPPRGGWTGGVRGGDSPPAGWVDGKKVTQGVCGWGGKHPPSRVEQPEICARPKAETKPEFRARPKAETKGGCRAAIALPQNNNQGRVGLYG